MDDAWIHQVYVHGLLRDGLPTYNPGEPEAGFSSLLWLLVQVPSAAVAGASQPAAAVAGKLMSLLFAVITALGLAALVRALGGRRGAQHLAVGLTFLTPGFAFAAVSGMEATLGAATVVWALVAFLHHRYLLTGVLLGLAGWARPELGVVAGLVGLAWLLQNPTGRTWRNLFALALPSILLGGIWVGFCLTVAGSPLPNTFYVKSGGLDLVNQLGGYLRIVANSGGLVLATTTGLLYVTGAATALRRPDVRRATGAVIGIQLLALSAIVLTRSAPALAEFPYHRYFLPLTMLDVVFVALGAERLVAAMTHRVPVTLAWLAALALALGPAVPDLLHERTSYEGHCVDTDVLHSQPARDLSEFATPDTVIAVEGAGAARHQDTGWILDLVGLNHAPLAHYDGDDVFRHCLIVGLQPGLFIVPDDWLPQFEVAFDFEVLRTYARPQWAAAMGQVGRTVVMARATTRPGVVSDCARRLGAGDAN